MKFKFLVLIVLFMFSFTDFALADPANPDGLEDIVTQSGSLASLIGKLALLIIGIAGIWLAASGFKRVVSDEQRERGGPLRIVIGMVLMAFPIIVAVSTGYFTPEEANVQEIIKNPFEG